MDIPVVHSLVRGTLVMGSPGERTPGEHILGDSSVVGKHFVPGTRLVPGTLHRH